MNAPTMPNGGKKWSGRRGRRRSDMEFLAPALEILETPPSPVRMALILVICGIAASALAWAHFGRIDIVATAQGKIEPLGRVKVVEPLQSGQISRILVTDGDVVAAGQIVAELDASEVSSTVRALTQQLQTAEAQVVRSRSAIEVVEKRAAGRVLEAPAVIWPANTPDDIKAREQRTLEHDVAQLAAELEGYESQIRQQRTNIFAIAATIAAREELIGTLRELASMRESLVEAGAMSRSEWLETLRTLQSEQVALTNEALGRADTEANIEVLESQVATTVRKYIAGHALELAEAEANVDELTERLTQARAQMGYMTLRSPVDGVVTASVLTTIGQVVTTGQEVMRIVPADATIEVQAFLSNTDVGFVLEGQEATVKVDAFPYTRYGTVPARITRIGEDAVSASRAQQILAGASQSADGGSGTAGNALVFPMLVELQRNHILIGDEKVPLSPGMAVTVDVNTGTRSILQYVLAPLVDIGATAMRER